jgi:hypothetical protein
MTTRARAEVLSLNLHIRTFFQPINNFSPVRITGTQEGWEPGLNLLSLPVQ